MSQTKSINPRRAARERPASPATRASASTTMPQPRPPHAPQIKSAKQRRSRAPRSSRPGESLSRGAGSRRPATLPHAHRVAPEAGSPLTGTRRNVRSPTTALVCFRSSPARPHMDGEGGGCWTLDPSWWEGEGGVGTWAVDEIQQGGLAPPPWTLDRSKSANRSTWGGVLQHDADIRGRCCGG